MKRAWVKIYNSYGICIKTFGGNLSEAKQLQKDAIKRGFKTTFHNNKKHGNRK